MQKSYQLILLILGINVCFVASQTTNVFDDTKEEATTTQCIEYYDDYTDDYALSFSSEHSSMRPAEIVGLVIGGIFLLSFCIAIFVLLVKHRTKLKQWWQKRELGTKKEKKPKTRTRGGGREELSEVRVDESETEPEVRPSQKIEHRRPHISNRHPETYRESREGEHYSRSQQERTPRVERNRSPQIQQSRSSARALPPSKSPRMERRPEEERIEYQERRPVPSDSEEELANRRGSNIPRNSSPKYYSQEPEEVEYQREAWKGSNESKMHRSLEENEEYSSPDDRPSTTRTPPTRRHKEYPDSFFEYPISSLHAPKPKVEEDPREMWAMMASVSREGRKKREDNWDNYSAATDSRKLKRYYSSHHSSPRGVSRTVSGSVLPMDVPRRQDDFDDL